MVRSANAVWKGNLVEGNGTVSVGSGLFKDTQYSFVSRFEEGTGTNPEELIGAALAGCYSMALAHGLAEAGYKPGEVRTSAKVHLDKVGDGFAITRIDLETEARVPGIDEKEFMEKANATKTGCPVSQALASTEITLTARLV